MTEIIKCPKCGTENRRSTIFCEKCGSKLPLFEDDNLAEPLNWLSQLRTSSDEENWLPEKSEEWPSEELDSIEEDKEAPDWLSRIRERKNIDEEFDKMRSISASMPEKPSKDTTGEIIDSLRSNENLDYDETSEINGVFQEINDDFSSRLDNISSPKSEENEIPDWLSKPTNEEKPLSQNPFIQDEEDNIENDEQKLPDWLRNGFQDSVDQEVPAENKSDQVPDWLTDGGLPSQSSTSPKQQEIPDWLADYPEDFQTENVNQSETQNDTIHDENPFISEIVPEETFRDNEKFQFSPSEIDEKKPDDISRVQEEDQKDEFTEQKIDAPKELLSGQKNVSPFVEEDKHVESPAPFVDFGKLPAWMDETDSFDEEKDDLGEQDLKSKGSFTPPSRLSSLNSENKDTAESSLAHPEIPDWISEMEIISEMEGKEDKEGPQPDSKDIELTPGILPNWLKSMKPVEVAAPSELQGSDKKKREQTGPLAGMQGLLSSENAANQYTPPPAYTTKINITEKQALNAQILDSILKQEKSSVSLSKGQKNRFNQILVFLLPILILVIIIASFFFSTSYISLPEIFPAETVRFATLTNLLISEPPNTTDIGPHLLLIVDGEIGSLAELRMTSQPVIEYLMSNNIWFSLISTKPEGMIVGSSIIQSANRNVPSFNASEKVAQLGYIPGDDIGIQSFIRDPQKTIPNGQNNGFVWNSTSLSSINNVSDYNAIYLITDNAENGKRWIEQLRSFIPDETLLVSTSAQSTPMLKPYVDSGQIDGMVSGLYGAISFMQINQREVGYFKTYWAAYQLGISVFILLILSGTAYQILKLSFTKPGGK